MLSAMLNRATRLATVYAEEEKHLVKPDQLDIYYEPPQATDTEVETDSLMFTIVSAGRQGITNRFPGLMRTHEMISGVCSGIVGGITGFYHNVTTNPLFLLKPAAILLAGGTGAVMAGKGKRPFKRTLFSLGYGGTAAAVINPERALEIAKTSYYHTLAIPSVIRSTFEREETITEKVMSSESDDAVADVIIEENAAPELADVVDEKVDVEVPSEELSLENVIEEPLPSDKPAEVSEPMQEAEAEVAIVMATEPVVDEIPAEDVVSSEAASVTTSVAEVDSVEITAPESIPDQPAELVDAEIVEQPLPEGSAVEMTAEASLATDEVISEVMAAESAAPVAETEPVEFATTDVISEKLDVSPVLEVTEQPVTVEPAQEEAAIEVIIESTEPVAETALVKDITVEVPVEATVVSEVEEAVQDEVVIDSTEVTVEPSEPAVVESVVPAQQELAGEIILESTEPVAETPSVANSTLDVPVESTVASETQGAVQVASDSSQITVELSEPVIVESVVPAQEEVTSEVIVESAEPVTETALVENVTSEVSAESTVVVSETEGATQDEMVSDSSLVTVEPLEPAVAESAVVSEPEIAILPKEERVETESVEIITDEKIVESTENEAVTVADEIIAEPAIQTIVETDVSGSVPSDEAKAIPPVVIDSQETTEVDNKETEGKTLDTDEKPAVEIIDKISVSDEILKDDIATSLSEVSEARSVS